MPAPCPTGRRIARSFKDYILGKSDGTPKTPEWAEQICGVKAADIRKLAEMYATTKPAALKASWAPGRAAYGEQYNRMAAALQAMTGNIGILGGSAEGVGKGWHAESVAYPYDENANVWYASIKSDRWAHCVLNYPNVKREEVGLWPRTTSSMVSSPTSRRSGGTVPTGSTSSPTSTRKSRRSEEG
jgi:anaerobic dimethyl sulfoxide reductase subunit A